MPSDQRSERRGWEVWRDRRGRLSILRIATLALLLFPLAKAGVEANVIAHGARPLNDLIHRAGFWTLIFLGLSLAVTPLRRVARYGALIDVRRMIGVGAFAYAAAHLALYVADQRFDILKVFNEITHRVYLIIGMAAWLGLFALAVTSTDAMTRKLGGRRWRRLHQLTYAISLLALIHYFQQTKADVSVPTFAAGLFAWLLGYRLLAWWRNTGDLSPLWLLLLSVIVAALTIVGEAVGIGIVFNVSPWRVLETVFDLDAGIRPGWLVLASGLCVVVLDAVRSHMRQAPPPRTAAAE
ncbi:MAG: ferric reductase-like transmembrane domain-containing protein [Pseudolabrys sp.]|nr:ferric reductase-like transmembrane domain-containing protein [Pseudolabrys sp.]